MAGRIAILCGIALLSLGTGNARGDVIPQLTSVTTSTINPADYTFTYETDVTNTETVQTGDFFTLYDFNGYVSGTAFAPSGWTLSVQNTGITPTGVTPVDDPNIVNLTWTYSGATQGPGPLNLGNFGADSIYGQTQAMWFTGLAHKYDPGHGDNNTPVANVGQDGGPAPVPEPPAVAMLAGTLSMGLTWRRLRPKRA
ncbi:MAG TPA: hypothetical protein VKT32_13745 [Chthonomonadaceae bacterium]|nr:hypothetical protein [Chthonomonadaceae bacterium]